MAKVSQCLIFVLCLWQQLPLQAQSHALPVPAVAPQRGTTLVPGALRAQLTAIAHQWGWSQVVWQVGHDYQWYGHVQFKSNTVYALFSKLLAPYPIQAVFYQGNHVLVFVPRRVS